ncbi:hypothetical protein [Furfurilactobacillus entadae]|uniref:hypothetical protein n=1 Tax=Furfurilactobacillus entadae TaxID=2922307 RepID=UPI0035EB4EA4
MVNLKKTIALGKFETNIVLDNKLVIVYTLLFPAVFFLYHFFAGGARQLASGQVLQMLSGYWSYIIVAGVLNGIINGMINMRENNFLKMFSFIAGDKRLIFYANLIPQIFVIQVELLIFNVIALCCYRADGHVILSTLVAMLINFILIPIIVFFTAFLLLVPMKGQESGIVITGYLVFGMGLLAVKSAQVGLNGILSFLAPTVYVKNVYQVLFSQTAPALMPALILSGIAVFYLLIGNLIIARINLNSATLR